MKKKRTALVPRPSSFPAVRPARTEVAEVRHTELVIPQGRSGGQVGTLIESRSVAVASQAEQQFEVDFETLCAAIKHVTQTIGEYKRRSNAFATYVIPALRKARRDMVADLEQYFGIHYEVDENGRSRFFTT